MVTKKIVSTDDGKIGTSEFRAQATTEAGKVFGVQSDGTVGLIESTTLVDDSTIEYNSDNKLQVKEKGLELDRLKSQSTTDSGKVVGVKDDGTMGLLEKQDVIQYSTMPTASASLVNKVIQYIGDTTTEFTNGVFYRCILSAESGDYEWKTASGEYLPLTGGYMTGTIQTEVDASEMGTPAIVGTSHSAILLIQSESGGGSGLRLFGSNYADNGFALTAGSSSCNLEGYKDGTLKWNNYNVLTTNDIADDLSTESATEALSANQGKVLNEKKQDVMQFSTMPTASATYLGKVVQYIGETGTYTQGTFYKCVLDSSSYNWEEISTGGCLPLSGGTMTGDINIGTHEIKDDNGNYLLFGSNSFELCADNELGGCILSGSKYGNLVWNNNYVLTHTNIINNLTSRSIFDALSANMGYELNNTKLSLSGGTMTGAIAMGSQKITGLATPTADTDACTKAYADKMLPLSGGTMTGAITMGTNAITLGSTNLVGNGSHLTWGGYSLFKYVQVKSGVLDVSTVGIHVIYNAANLTVPTGYACVALSAQPYWSEIMVSGVTLYNDGPAYLPAGAGTYKISFSYYNMFTTLDNATVTITALCVPATLLI